MAVKQFSTDWVPTPLPMPKQAPAAIRLPPSTRLRRVLIIFKLWWIFWSREAVRWMFPLLSKGRVRTPQQAQKLRELAERLGGIWVSLARLLSLRSDLLGVEFCKELARAGDRGAPLPFPVIRQTIDEELRSLGTSFDETFERFAETPLAVRSFGQFHRARMRGGDQEVVVRVRVPDALERAAFDLRYMQRSFALISKFGILSHLRWNDLLFEVKKYTDNLLDFRIQLSQLDKIRKILRRQDIYVPRLAKRLCTERLLISEYIGGPSLADLERASSFAPESTAAWMWANGIHRGKLWRRLFNAHQQLLFEHNLFYTDASPSTIVVLRGNRLAFVGFNVIGTLSSDLHRRYMQLCRALLSGDYTKVADISLILGPPIPHMDLTDLRMSVIRMMRRWSAGLYVKQRPYAQKSMAAMMGCLSRCVSEQGLPTFWSLARLHLAEWNLDQALGFLDSSRNYVKAMRRYQREAEQRSIFALERRQESDRRYQASDAFQIGVQLLENFEHDGDYLRRRLVGYRETAGQFSQAMRRFFALVVKGAVAVLLVQGYLYLRHAYQAPPTLLGQSTKSYVFALLHLDKRTHWVLLLLYVLLLLRLFYTLLRKLFSVESGPMRDS